MSPTRRIERVRDGAIRSLIDKIRLVPVDGELRIEIKGELAGILELCDAGANQKPGGLSTAGLAEQISTRSVHC
jgi:hypothetical protein